MIANLFPERRRLHPSGVLVPSLLARTGARRPSNPPSIQRENMADSGPSQKRPRPAEAGMLPPSKLPEKSPRLAPAEASAVAGSSSSTKMLTTVDEVLAAFPASPKNGPAATPSARSTSPSDDVLGISPGLQPLKSPPFPDVAGGAINGTRAKPSGFSSEPPPLDLLYCGGVFESPALMPASAIGSIPAMDYLGPQMSR